MQNDTATQTGVELNEQGETIGTQNPRNQAMAEIAAKANQEFEETVRSAEENIYQEGREEEAAPVVEPPQEDMVTIKVDGEERQVPRALIEEAGIKTLQKESAADRRLEEATMLFKQAQELQKNLQPPQGAAPAQTEDESVQLARAIQYGSEEEAAAVIKRLQAEGRSQATPEQMAAFIGDQIELREAFKSFKTDYPEIQSDPHLTALAIQMEDSARRNGDKRPYRELYSAIGEHLRTWRGGNTSTVEKRERKATVQTIPTAAGRLPAPVQPKPKTTAEILDDIRRARHQI